MSNDTHLVLGGNGFIGQYVVQHLLTAGHTVRIFDRNPTPRFPVFDWDDAALDVRVGDFMETAAIEAALQGVTCLHHFASTTNPGKSARDPIFDVETNLVGSINLLQACVDAGVERIVFSSSGGTVYGKLHEIPAPETHPTHPISAHGIVKLAIEKYMQLAQHQHGIAISILRIANPYGPGQDPHRGQGVINAFLSRIAQGDDLHVWGDGSVVRDYLYVDDVGRAALKAAESDNSGVYNIATMQGHSLNDVIDLLYAVTNSKVEVSYDDARAFDVPTSILHAGRARDELGWQAQTSLEAGIRQTWQWMQQYSRES